jgi:hypothetical protein
MWTMRVQRLGLVLALASAVVHAHEGEPDAGVPSSPHRTVVRDSRSPHTPSETVIKRELLDATPKSGATDLLRMVPGLVASQHSGEGKAQQLFLRGFDAVHGQDVELNVAGLPVNEVSHLHALGYADLNWLIPEVVREVRVTEGSARAWQGDFAVAGTVRYELGLEEEGFTAAVSRGAFNRTRLFAGYRPADNEQTFAAVEYVDGDGFGPERGFHRISALGQGVLQVGRARLRAVVGSYGTTFESPGVVREDSGAFFEAFGRGQGGQSGRHQALVGVELPVAGGRSNLEIFGQVLDLTLKNNFTGYLRNAAGDGLQQTQSTSLFGVRATDARHLHFGDQVLRLETGLSLRHDRIVQSQRGYDELTGELRAPVSVAGFREGFDAKIAQTLGSAWGELSWAPGAWRFMLGGRVDLLHVELQGEGPTRNAFGPHAGLKAGLERGLGEHFRLFLTYGDGFRTPQARQLSNGETAPFVDVRGGDLGVRFESSRVSASLLGFVSGVSNDFFFDHLVGSTSFVGPTLRGGAQAAVTARPIDDLLVSLNVTAAQARLLEREALLPYFAPLVGRLDAGWKRSFEVQGVTLTPKLGLGLTLIGPRPLPFDEFSRTVFLVDARAGVRVGPMEISFDVQNLLDARWRDGEFVFASKWNPSSASASLLPARQFTAGPPRTFLVTLEVHL